MTNYRTLESDRLEIVLVAAGVLVLVSVLGILILMAAGLKPKARDHDAENCQRRTSWRSSRQEQLQSPASTEPYDDESWPFLASVRRKSQSLVEDFQQELIHFRRGSMASRASRTGPPIHSEGVADRIMRFSLDNVLASPPREVDPELGCESGCEYIDSPISATGRDDVDKARRRSTRPAMKSLKSCNEAQLVDDLLL